MPLVLDTNETCELVLTTDKGKENKPTFLLRFLSHRDWMRAAHLIDEAEELLETKPTGNTSRELSRNAIELSGKAFGKTVEAFKIALVGWKNIDIPFDPNKLEDILSDWDAAEIRNKMLDELTITELDKKKHALSLQHNGGTDAKSIVVNEKTAPPQPNP